MNSNQASKRTRGLEPILTEKQLRYLNLLAQKSHIAVAKTAHGWWGTHLNKLTKKQASELIDIVVLVNDQMERYPEKSGIQQPNKFGSLPKMPRPHPSRMK